MIEQPRLWIRLALFLMAAGLGLTSTLRAAEKRRPNIVFLMTDDQTDVATGCYGNTQVKTPNMDRLATEGILFRNHYNTTAICMASRVCVMTGMYEYKHGCNFMHGNLKPALLRKSYPLLLREAGYFTGFAGKIGFTLEGKPFTEFARHFDVWAGGRGQTKYRTRQNPLIAKYAKPYPHSSRAYAAWAGDFFTSAKNSGKPFCMSISFKAPHLPFTPDPAFDDVYRDTRYRKPANYGKRNARHLSPQSKTGRQFHSYRFWTNSEASYQESIRKYNQLIHGVDVALGMIRDSLKQQGLADNTVIIFTSDNGYSCGAHGFGGKVLPYEEASRSPLIIYDPRQPANQRGKKRDIVTGNIDMAPTILALAGVAIPDNIDGVSLVPALENAKPIPRQSIALLNLWGNREIQELSVVTKDWKYIYWSYESETMKPTEELFHVAEDRLEMKNLAADPAHAAQLARMRAIYDQHFGHLKRNAVGFNDYAKYKVLFDRGATLEQKAPLLKPRAPKRRRKRKTAMP